jgi:hypothetical protein
VNTGQDFLFPSIAYLCGVDVFLVRDEVYPEALKFVERMDESFAPQEARHFPDGTLSSAGET